VRDAGGDVQQLTGARDEVLAQPLAVPHSGFPGEHIDRRLMVA
jgi:hypothetical protein